MRRCQQQPAEAGGAGQGPGVPAGSGRAAWRPAAVQGGVRGAPWRECRPEGAVEADGLAQTGAGGSGAGGTCVRTCVDDAIIEGSPCCSVMA